VPQTTSSSKVANKQQQNLANMVAPAADNFAVIWGTRRNNIRSRWIVLHKAFAPGGYADRGDNCLLASALSRSLGQVPCQVEARARRQPCRCLLLTGLAHSQLPRVPEEMAWSGCCQGPCPASYLIVPSQMVPSDLLVLSYPRAIYLQVVLGNSYFCWFTALTHKGQSHHI
jgi:hypothetical protein